jgi:hypothetical protein
MYNTSGSTVFLNNQIGDYFKTTVGVRQGCLLSPVLFNLFLENMTLKTLHNFHSIISIGGKTISNLRFADDIDLMGGSNKELQDLTNRLEDRAGAYGMEVGTDKSKTMVNSTTNTQAEIFVNGQQLEEVDSFKFLCVILTKDGHSTTEIKTISNINNIEA